jgi:hypothetical protein
VQKEGFNTLSEFMADQTSNESMQRLSQDEMFAASSSPVSRGRSIFVIFEWREGRVLGRGM